jgi:hypothetical protein
MDTGTPPKTHTSEPPKSIVRSRYLNVIWFFDANKTKTVRIPETRIPILVSLIAFLLVWLITATLLAHWNMNYNRFLLDENKLLKRSILGYQIKHEELYEKVYLLPPVDRVEEEMREEITEDIEPTETPGTLPVEIRDIRVDMGESRKLSVNYNVVNLDPGTRVSGSSWIQVYYTDREFSEKYVYAPLGLRFDSAGRMIGGSSATAFAIMRLKSFEFTLDPPQDFQSWGRIRFLVQVNDHEARILKEMDIKP